MFVTCTYCHHNGHVNIQCECLNNKGILINSQTAALCRWLTCKVCHCVCRLLLYYTVLQLAVVDIQLYKVISGTRLTSVRTFVQVTCESVTPRFARKQFCICDDDEDHWWATPLQLRLRHWILRTCNQGWYIVCLYYPWCNWWANVTLHCFRWM